MAVRACSDCCSTRNLSAVSHFTWKKMPFALFSQLSGCNLLVGNDEANVWCGLRALGVRHLQQRDPHEGV